MDVEILQNDGVGAGRSTTLDPTVFEIEPNDHVIWLDVKRIQAHERQGTAKTKQRAEVRGSGRKLYRQKGTGNARVGDAQSPIRRGGGRAHGAIPRKYRQNLNRKTKRLARRSALSYAAERDGIRVVDDLSMERPSTGGLTDLLDALDIGDRKVFLITQDVEEEVYLSARNLSNVSVQEVGSVNTVQLLDAEVLLFEEDALRTLTDTLSVAEPEAA
jgi:large subunit ribosomal protein L4